MTALLMTFLLLTSCGAQKQEENTQPIEISMYLWDKGMTRELTPWLE